MKLPKLTCTFPKYPHRVLRRTDRIREGDEFSPRELWGHYFAPVVKADCGRLVKDCQPASWIYIRPLKARKR